MALQCLDVMIPLRKGVERHMTEVDDRERMTLRISNDVWKLIKDDIRDKKEKSANELITKLLYKHYNLPQPE